jgi:hypothetical protein
MSQENERQEDMRPEYDIRGGVRGKYFGQYLQSLTLEDSPLVAKNTASAPQIGSITRPPSYPPALPSPRIHIGGPIRPTTHAGSNPSRR